MTRDHADSSAQPDISVVIVSWNTRDLLDLCLASLESERAALALAVTVVDNGSTDGSQELVSRSHPHVTLKINPDNRGFSGANNQGISESRGRYVLLLNSDTEVEPGALRALLEYGDARPEVGILGPRLLNSDGTLQPSGGRFPTPWSTVGELLGLDRLTGHSRYGTERDYSVPAVVDEVSGAAMLVRATVFAQVGVLDESFAWGYEDVDLCHRAHDAGWEVHYVPGARIKHVWGASRCLAPASTVLKAIDGRRHYFLKHHGFASSALVMAATVPSHAVRAVIFAAAGLFDPEAERRAAIEWIILTGLIRRRT